MSDSLNQHADAAPEKKQPVHVKPGMSHSPAHPGQWSDLPQASRDRLGFHPDSPPQVITINNWSKNPWLVVGSNGKDLITLSGMNLSVIKATTTAGAPSLYWTMTYNVVSHGWTTYDPYTSNVNAAQSMVVNLLNAQSGLLLGFRPLFGVSCGATGNGSLDESFTTDVFSLIAGAHLSLESTTFWPC